MALRELHSIAAEAAKLALGCEPTDVTITSGPYRTARVEVAALGPVGPVRFVLAVSAPLVRVAERAGFVTYLAHWFSDEYRRVVRGQSDESSVR